MAFRLQCNVRQTSSYLTGNAATLLILSYVAGSGISLALPLHHLGPSCGFSYSFFGVSGSSSRRLVLIQPRELWGWSFPCVTIMIWALALQTSLFAVKCDDVPPQCTAVYFLGSARNELVPVGRFYVDFNPATLSAFYGTALSIFRRI